MTTVRKAYVSERGLLEAIRWRASLDNPGDEMASTKSGTDGSFRLGPIRAFHAGIMTLEGIQPRYASFGSDTPSLGISRIGYQP